MSNKPAISIIIPTSGTSEYIEECLNSIYRQNLKEGQDFEVLIGIDHCEESKIVLNRINQNYSNLRVFYFLEKCGPYIIRNTLARMSVADYFLFFDSDDLMPEQFLSKTYQALNSADVIFYYYKFFIDTQNVDGISSRSFDYHLINKIREEKIFVGMSSGNTPKSRGKKSFYARVSTNLKNGNIFKLNFYINWAIKTYAHAFLSGAFVIRKELFFDMDGFRPWPVGADTELKMRLKKFNIDAVKMSYRSPFYKRVHEHNLTLAKDKSIGSSLRNRYDVLMFLSIGKKNPMVTSGNYYKL